MKIEIKTKKENKLIGRLELEGLIQFDGATPSNEVLRDKLAVELKADKDLIVIKHIYSRFGYPEAEFLAYIYDNKETRRKMEVMTKHLKKKLEEEKKKAEEEKKKAAEAKKEEAEAKEEKAAEKEEEKKEEEKEKKEEKPGEGKE